eukprot:CAMPEP_0206446540 /NCGR_PEP_ID=MMETSP0324_2-20121206/16195_1 /ASSEMBLY_ACC=CAM_ASM_000836 /TAXON_ID=2866 /ORGANISM="Crypthecodinium cohnii, Strain Seligo" /LENGTH=41 /DNA_ID= /DNA_START= /DNA_END= /DNA_ORIENTATION=
MSIATSSGPGAGRPISNLAILYSLSGAANMKLPLPPTTEAM